MTELKSVYSPLRLAKAAKASVNFNGDTGNLREIILDGDCWNHNLHLACELIVFATIWRTV